MSPSRSRSAAMTLTAPLATVEMTFSFQAVPDPFRFSYQAILSSFTEAERASMSPSPSTSAANTERASSADRLITCCGPKLPAPSRFGYHAILSSCAEADRVSRSPSPSTSAAKTDQAKSAAVEMTLCSKNPALRWIVRFSYQETLSSSKSADRTSRSPSLSRSAADTLRAPTAELVIVWGVQVGWGAPLFSYQAIRESAAEADRTSRSPSPSTSAAKTPQAESAVLVMMCFVQSMGGPANCSYQAIVSSRMEAERTSMSPSPSRSAAKTVCAPSAVVVIVCGIQVGGVAPLFSYQEI